ncbi:hypothetical protein PHYBLDRAFT_117063 [Phycomyces blakesleeanus NRRL 1555(-)]|uniref:Elongator complex protein 2 n=1 Tax=Phycomyces blakesleeanus (strain ATCC 8743b / DSM 1359 / FGSC 10004 / NBRC 33097 / NRRL 1555) TaxID=763407 RepID=A0A162NEB2_PHYB8|nr:hypothetical protein PHYBLDRAFT_117063 [Phycomyces blakesleeanus NRRL 1555(-)]OAD68764.1 hypothetical protein PHYBLDRAFT_117063 [Phycomyces blakesleeanus NRRL 1555(-)]|eukprot:XP_018286804.1 hypothetical protein PHYBLDRAFT_117063 [Phycomyces blakesleeanus NRRL 1555(-)]
MPKVSTEFIAIGANRTAHTASWGLDGLVAFGANKLIALYNPLDPTSRGITETLQGHKQRVICVEFIERGNLSSVALVSGSADNTAKIWKKNSLGQWINSATLTGHTGAVETVACMKGHCIMGDTDLLATGSADGTIRIWERRILDDSNVTCLQVIDCGNKYPLALALAYLPGTTVPILASGNTDKVISIYIYQHGVSCFKRAHTLQGHDNWVRSLAFATYTGTDANINEEATHTLRTGNLMLASASQDKYIRLWKIAPEAHLVDVDVPGSERYLFFYQNNMRSNDTEIFYSKKQYSLMFEALLMGHDDWVYSVNWERPRYSGNTFIQPLRLISASSDKSLMIWSPDTASGVWVNEVRMGDMGGNSYLGFCGALFSPDGKHVVSHGANGSFHMWRDISTKDEENRWAPEVSISGHFKPVESVAWDPHSRYLLSASLDQSTRLYAPWCRSTEGKKVVTWHEMGRPQVHGYDLKCIAFVNDWQFVSGADEKVLRVFDAPKSCVESLAVLTGEKGLTSEESRPIGANLPALGLSNKAVFEGDIETMVNSEENHATLQSYAQSSSTPTSLLETMVHPPFEEHLLQHTLWPEIEKLYGHGYEIICTEATHDGKYVASACKAATPEHAVVRLFDTSNWKEVKTKINAHSLTVTRVRFSHNDRWLLTVSRDRVWSISERVEGNQDVAYRLTSKNQAHARIIWDCAWSHDDKFFVTGSRDKTVKFWEQKDGTQWTCVATIKCTEPITALDAAPILVDGR